jgi:hypothetical protein
MRRSLRLLLVVLLLAGALGAPDQAAAAGRIRLLVPEIGIDTSLRTLRCGVPRLPDGRVYVWGCIAAPNRYLLSHAWGTFRPLRFAAERGQLRRGMRLTLIYPSGTRERYRLTDWAIFRNANPWPTRVGHWMVDSGRAISLQTCLYRNSSGRVVAHFVPVK